MEHTVVKAQQRKVRELHTASRRRIPKSALPICSVLLRFLIQSKEATVTNATAIQTSGRPKLTRIEKRRASTWLR